MKTLSQEHEADVMISLAKLGLHAKLQRGSGNTPEQPADIEVKDHFFVECKATTKASMSFKLQWFQYLIKRSLQQGMRGVLALRFKIGRATNDYYVVEAEFFHHLLECEQQLV